MNEAVRISIDTKEISSQALVLQRKLASLGYTATVSISSDYTITPSLTPTQAKLAAAALHSEIVENARIDQPFAASFDWALEIGFLPGVTDNIGHTATEMLQDVLKQKNLHVFSSKVLFLSGKLSLEEVETIAKELSNPLIERHHIKSHAAYTASHGMDLIVPLVRLSQDQTVLEVDLAVPDAVLLEIGKKGIKDLHGKHRGPLALDLASMKAIQSNFAQLGRKASDIEIESLAQTWSEHCKHTIFASELDEIQDGLYKHYIKRATQEIRKKHDICISVFSDNAGGIIFDDEHLITHKVETHNTPSALDPFGGAITGIVGVNRDTIGFGLGALPIANAYGFCVGRPEDTRPLYRSKGSNKTLSPRRILDGVVAGINVGGNCSGIPTPTGFLYFDDSYRGKPLVFAGTVGFMPRKLPDGALSHMKKAMPGDNIVVVGGRVGKDGIHGATFSSETLDEGSPASAVQIGDPITQKKLSDAIVKEARDRRLYSSITDNGAGGISCSVAEMAKESGGFCVNLERVPLKYPGLQPWEIWISESQERMTLAVPQHTLKEFLDLMESRGVEASVIGVFTDSGKAVVKMHGKTILDLDMHFLHEGIPKKRLTSEPYPYNTKEHATPVHDHVALLQQILGNHNNASFEFISKQYDHEVQATSVIKPLQGKGRVNGQSAIIRPRLDSYKGVVLSHALYPRLSELDAYAMAAAAIDTAIRHSLACGGTLSHIALLDNFCWCSSDDPKRLSQLKDACRACYEYATAFGTPFISGKDSMYNDLRCFDEQGNALLISALPTLLISSIGVVADVREAISIDFKQQGDIIYVLGNTHDECGASEFYHALDIQGGTPPRLDALKARILYEHFERARKHVSACMAVGPGGLGIALAKMAIAGGLGAHVDLTKVPSDVTEASRILFSESQSRFIVTVPAKEAQTFEAAMKGTVFSSCGIVGGTELKITFGKTLIDTSVEKLAHTYKERFSEF